MDEKIELKLTKGNILRFLNACFILLFFMPTMLVSCSGETVKISASRITFGFEVLGQKIDGHIAGILMLILPIACLVLLCLAQTRANKKTIIVIKVLNFINFIAWVSYFNGVDKEAKENYCESEMTGWMILLMLFMVIHCVITFMCLFQSNASLQQQIELAATGGNPAQMQYNGFGSKSKCPTCGADVKGGDMFCLKCGTKLKKTCPTCGAEMDGDSRFCSKCGTEVTE
ncbi:zinc ribbon domain-containing protein [Butyrivibrio sp. AD3002]|uniref:zinc ribbon domain-containing protein n=1 Tax=Butyrivibrio sp. AD3002 TaxID=1280670 RepID=UPI0003B6F5CC|nr:zinc ribbon domain-containing protein [Butyrivibrio sp. AD3002]